MIVTTSNKSETVRSSPYRSIRDMSIKEVAEGFKTKGEKILKNKKWEIYWDNKRKQKGEIVFCPECGKKFEKYHDGHIFCSHVHRDQFFDWWEDYKKTHQGYDAGQVSSSFRYYNKAEGLLELRKWDTRSDEEIERDNLTIKHYNIKGMLESERKMAQVVRDNKISNNIVNTDLLPF